LLAGRSLRRLDRDRLLFALSELLRAQPLLCDQAVRQQAVRVRRVGDVGQGRPGVHEAVLRLVNAHPRVKMLAYNQGNQPTSVFRLYRYPRAAKVMRHALRATRFTSRVTTP